MWCGLNEKTDVHRLCVTVIGTRVRGLEISPKAMHFWKSGFKYAFLKVKRARFL